EELPPDQKPDGANVRWVTGYWQWDDERRDFLWVSGFWRDVPPGRQWLPGGYRQTADGWQWVPGFWAEAGRPDVTYLPPPPVPPALLRPGFTYCPRYVVAADFLPGALFVRGGGYRHYYFGDYFGPRYARAYTPFLDARLGPSAPDPLFAYDRAARGAGWEREVRGLYAGRAAGDVVAPPRTLAQQETLVRNIEV